MRSRHRRSARDDLRRAVGCLPARTRVAMLEGIDRNEIIVGAYTDRHGGVCPMLAAHRCGGRTALESFAHAWDRFAAARRPRPATQREIATLVALLKASLAPDADLRGAIADHQRTARARRAREATATGWEWLEGLPDLEPGLLEEDLGHRAAR